MSENPLKIGFKDKFSSLWNVDLDDLHILKSLLDKVMLT